MIAYVCLRTANLPQLPLALSRTLKYLAAQAFNIHICPQRPPLLYLAHSVNELIVALTKMLRSLCLQGPLILLNVCLFSRPATPLTYWVDSSCAAYPNLNAIFSEMQYMAATVLRRQNWGSNDPAFQWAFYNILKVHPEDNTIFTLPGSYTGTAAEIVSCKSLIDVVCRRPARLTSSQGP